MKKIRIEIGGRSNTGRTTIAELIRKTLEENGIEATIEDTDIDRRMHLQPQRLEALKKDPPSVHIKVFTHLTPAREEN